jgi:hypothetical protein
MLFARRLNRRLINKSKLQVRSILERVSPETEAPDPLLARFRSSGFG